MFWNYEGSVIPRLNEIANIKFNTGVRVYSLKGKTGIFGLGVYATWI